MILKLIKSRSFSATAQYAERGNALERKEQNQLAERYGIERPDKGQLIYQENCFGKWDEVAAQMENVRQEHRPGLGLCCQHIIVAFDHTDKDKVDNLKLAEIGQNVASGLGFQNAQYSIWRHDDREHLHLHIVANRVSLDGTVVSDSLERYKAASIARTEEIRHGLRTVQNPQRVQERNHKKLRGLKSAPESLKNAAVVSPYSHRGFKRSNGRIEAFRADVDVAISKSETFSELKGHLERQGYTLQTGFGFAMERNGVKFKGKELGLSKKDIDERIQAAAQARRQQDRQQIASATTGGLNEGVRGAIVAENKNKVPENQSINSEQVQKRPAVKPSIKPTQTL